VFTGALFAIGSVGAEIIFNQTKINMLEAIVDACVDGLPSGNAQNFQDRCNGLLLNQDDLVNGINQVSPEQ